MVTSFVRRDIGMGKIKKEKASTNANEKKGKVELPKKKKNCDKKKNSADDGNRKFGYVSARSVVAMAEAAGFTGLQEDVAKNLAEDVTYRLRYIIQQCKKFMIHNKRSKLSCADINEVLKMCDASAIHGHSIDQNFIYIKEADVFVLEDNPIDLPSFALNEIRVNRKVSHVAAGFWLKSDDLKQEIKVKSEEVKGCDSDEVTHLENSKPGNVHLKFGNNSNTCENETKIPTNLIKYYGITCNTILGHSDLRLVFQDLSKNGRILPIVPYLLNFITIALNKLGSERQIKRLLQTIEALSRNTSIDFSPYSATARVINAMLLIVAVDKKPAKHSYGYQVRSYAARVLAAVLSEWCVRDEQRTSIDKKMGKLIADSNASPRVHYGAIALLTAMGPETLTHNLCRVFKDFLEHLDGSKRSSENVCASQDAASMLEELILDAAARLYRWPESQSELLSELDLYLYSYFGDAVCVIWTTPEFSVTTLPSHHVKRNPERTGTDGKCYKYLKYFDSRYKPEANGLTLESAFALPKARKRRNCRIIFKFAGAIPVPEVNLKRRGPDGKANSTQFIAGRESEGHVVVAGKRTRHCVAASLSAARPPPAGCLSAIL